MIQKIALSLWVGLLCNHVLAKSPEAVNNSMAEGVALARERAAKGDPNHQYRFATMHIAGAGVPEDPTKAAKWLRLAANQGHTKAQSTLGRLYLSGLGVPKDFFKAYMWASLAAARGESEAINPRDALAEELTPEQLTEAKKWQASAKPVNSEIVTNTQ